MAGGLWNSVQTHPAGGVLSVLHPLAGAFTEGGEHAGDDGFDDGEGGDEAVVGEGAATWLGRTTCAWGAAGESHTSVNRMTLPPCSWTSSAMETLSGS